MNRVFLLFIMVFYSEINYAQWYFVNPESVTQDLRSVKFVDENTGWVVGNNGTILKTTNAGDSWTFQTSNTDERLESVSFYDENNGIIVGFIGTTLRTTDGGENWIKGSIDVTKNWEDICFLNSSLAIIVGADGIVLKSTDKGATWVQKSSGVSTYLMGVSLYNSSVGYAVGRDGVIIKTTDGGENWTRQDSPTIEQLESISCGDINNVTAVGILGIITRTTNGGGNWFMQNGGISCGLEDVFMIDANNAFAVGLGVILKTTNGGSNWITQESGTTNELFDVCFTDINNGTIAGVGGVILHTSNSALPVELSSFRAEVSGSEITLNWQTATEVHNYGFDVERMKDLKIERLKEWEKIGFVPGSGNSNSPKVYSFTDRIACYDTILYRLKQIDNDGQIKYSESVSVLLKPNEFGITQNYPNPFNPVTVIKYQIPKSTFVSLKLFDILGKEVKTLVNEEKQPGEYEVKIDGSGLSSGVYLYQIIAGDYIQTHKMILQK